MTQDQLKDVTRRIDSLVLTADSQGEMYRKLNILQSNGRGGWILLRCPCWKNGILVAVVIRVTPLEPTL
jgi:hypothetical protein